MDDKILQDLIEKYNKDIELKQEIKEELKQEISQSSKTENKQQETPFRPSLSPAVYSSSKIDSKFLFIGVCFFTVLLMFAGLFFLIYDEKFKSEVSNNMTVNVAPANVTVPVNNNINVNVTPYNNYNITIINKICSYNGTIWNC